MPERSGSGKGLVGGAVALVLAVTAARLVALWFDRTDLFVDEAQYWAWGQSLDWGYFSKPPMIGWVIRAVTDLAGSDAPFWIRMPGPVCHGATALILAAAARRLWNDAAAAAVAVGYVTLPMTALGSLLFSTDTVMAPFYAGALLFWARLVTGAGRGAALGLGLCVGGAVMSKYAGIYAPLGMALAALFVPAARMRTGDAGIAAAVAALIVAPNVAWNLGHDLTTLSHTVDNVDWVKADPAAARGLNWSSLAAFAASQAAVVGPVVLLALVLRPFRPDAPRALLWMSLPVLALICGQALVSRAYANWAIAAYFAGALAALPWLAARRGRWRLSLGVNGALCVILPLLAIFPAAFSREGTPLLSRYLGRAAVSEAALAAARREGAAGIVASSRDLLADLVYTGRESGVAIHARPPRGAPESYYEQTIALPPDAPGPLLFLGTAAPGACAVPVGRIETAGGAYAGREIGLWRIEGACRDVLG